MSPCIEEVRIPVAGAVLAGTLLFPAGAGSHPSLVLLTGSGANDRDETIGRHTPLRTLAEWLVRHGHAVLRCDDRGVGDSTGDPDAQDFGGAVADAVAMGRWLAGHPAIDPKRIVLLGHSEGGLVAARAGPMVGARAVVMLAGPAVPIEVLLHEQARLISEEDGATAAQIAHERRMNEEVFALARSNGDGEPVRQALEGVIRRFLQSWPDLPSMDADTVAAHARAMAGIVGAPSYRSLLRQVPADLIGACTLPLLGVYGGRDTQVPGTANAAAFREITARHRQAAVAFFPAHNHLFQPAITGSIAEYETLPPGPDEPVLRAVVGWLDALDGGGTAGGSAH